MTPLQVGALVGSLVAGGVGCVVRAVQRAPRSLAAARHTMTGSVPLPGRPTQSPVAAQRWRDGLEHVGDALGERLRHGELLGTAQLACLRCAFGLRSPRTNQSRES